MHCIDRTVAAASAASAVAAVSALPRDAASAPMATPRRAAPVRGTPWTTWLRCAGLAVALAAAGCASAPDDGARPSGRPPAIAEPPVRLPAPARLQSMLEVQVQAALRVVAAHPNGTYEGDPPDVLLAIPVLEVELNADGSVRHVTVKRRPGQAEDTLQTAVDAVYRAAPYGDVSHLPRPWVYTEVFLFRDDRRFKPRTLDR